MARVSVRSGAAVVPAAVSLPDGATMIAPLGTGYCDAPTVVPAVLGSAVGGVGSAGAVVGGVVVGVGSGVVGEVVVGGALAAVTWLATVIVGRFAATLASDEPMVTRVIAPSMGASVSSRSRSTRYAFAGMARTRPVTSTPILPTAGVRVESIVASRLKSVGATLPVVNASRATLRVPSRSTFQTLTDTVAVPPSLATLRISSVIQNGSSARGVVAVTRGLAHRQRVVRDVVLGVHGIAVAVVVDSHRVTCRGEPGDRDGFRTGGRRELDCCTHKEREQHDRRDHPGSGRLVRQS